MVPVFVVLKEYVNMYQQILNRADWLDEARRFVIPFPGFAGMTEP